MSLFGSDPEFDPADEFVAEHLPAVDPFLADHDVLTGKEHASVHRQVAEAFEAHGVYDATFGYNLARLNRDPRHPDAGFRYAVERSDPTTLRATFTPTTAFCPQAEPLAVGAYRALNTVDAHGYDHVRIRVDDSLHGSGEINGRLKGFESSEEEPPALGGDEACESGGTPPQSPF